MTISKFKFENKSLNWRLEEMLLNKLTLLVGASGVGKTQILRSLMALKEIADGEALDGLNWRVEFKSLDQQNYIWEGEFESKGSEFLMATGNGDITINKPKILYEKLWLNDALLVDRNQNQILFLGQATLKLSQEHSALHLLKEEEKIKPAYLSMKKLDFTDYADTVNSNKYHPFKLLDAKNLLNKYNSIQKIQESHLNIVIKLFLIQELEPEIFDKIKQNFIDIFPQVEDLRIANLESKDKELENLLKDIILIQIKEENVDHWIVQNKISSGMYRVLIELSELYLCAEGTVFLIDEFENSLGINCINEITHNILASQRNLQFIITSHHPYIINNIGYENWKLVTRNAGVIKAQNVDKFNIGKSKHQAFMQLLQLDEYQTGRE